MNTVTLHLSDETAARLRQAAEDLGQRIEDLCYAAIDEQALDYFRYQPSRDPARDLANANSETREMA